MRIETNSVRWIERTFLILVVAGSASLAWGLYRGISDRQPSGGKTNHDMSQITTYTKEGRYDDAVQLGLQLLKNDPTDEIVYQQIADVYLVRAKNDPVQRQDWVAKAISYVEKSLTLNSKQADVAGVHLFQDARSFELAGDLSTHERCDYYQRATKLLQERTSTLQGDQVTLAGRTFPLEPLRNENNKILSEVSAKAAEAQCK